MTRIAAGLYSHWHPDHTAGRRVWESRNFDFRSWPRRFETTPIYVPERGLGRLRGHYGLADQFRFLERQGTVRIVLVADERRRSSSADAASRRSRSPPRTRTPFCSRAAASASSSRWTRRTAGSRPRSGRSTSRVLPIGVFEHHPFSGERLIPEEFCRPPVKKTRYAQALELLARSRRGGPCSPTSRRWTGSPTTSSSASARQTAGSRPSTGCSSRPEQARGGRRRGAARRRPRAMPSTMSRA